MARQLGAIRYIGRLANTVGYKARDGKGDSFDAMREHTVDVANPQTLAQMSQRMKLTPVQNFYRGLAGLLDHSWQGVKYGNPSRLHFYSLALRALSTAGCPYINKGDRTFVPWQFPISSGSIGANPILKTNNFVDGVIEFEVKNATVMGPTSTVADFTNLALQISGIEEGMQLTFIWVFIENQTFIPIYKRIVLSLTDTTKLTDLGFSPYADAGDDDVQLQCVNNGSAIALELAAAGLIVSKKIGDVWQRNNANMIISDAVLTAYNSEAAYLSMLESYRKSTNSDSPWYLNEGSGETIESGVVENDIYIPTESAMKRLAWYEIGNKKYIPYYIKASKVTGYRKGGPMAFTQVDGQAIGDQGNEDVYALELSRQGYTLITHTLLAGMVPELTWTNAN